MEMISMPEDNDGMTLKGGRHDCLDFCARNWYATFLLIFNHCEMVFHAYLLAIVKKNLRKNLAHESIGICPSPAGKFVLRNFFFP